MQKTRVQRAFILFAQLHVRSWFSFLAGGSSPEGLVAQAGRVGVSAMAVTDVDGVYGAVRFQKACREVGIKPIFGAEVRVEGAPLVLLAASQAGYSNLCRLLTTAHLRDRARPEVTMEELAERQADLFCLTGASGSRLWQLLDDDRWDEARRWVLALKGVFAERLSIEVTHHLLPGDSRRVRRLHRMSVSTGIPLLATGDVRYANPEDYRRYDLLTCIRLGITVFDPHPERPFNGEAYLKPEAALRRLIPHPEAFARAAEVAGACRVDLLPGYITPPAAHLDKGTPPREELERLCRRALQERYPPQGQAPAARQLRRELSVIFELKLEEFFLVVHEIAAEARRRGIRCAGRGSAANSIVAYLLGITGVDPIAHNLLFERFLHGGRKGTPDIDMDFDSERREEIIGWMEERFGIEQTAMTATVVTYQLRSALRDVAKALGWSMDQLNKLSKAVAPGRARQVELHRVRLEQIVPDSPLFASLLEMTAALDDCPRHLGQHSGGMVLSRKPLFHFTPIQVSANGVKVVQFDKLDVEALGLVKFDVLGLRMLATLSEADEIIQRHENVSLRLDDLPLDDTPTFNMIRASKTLGVFQIESQGQLHLLAQNQPDDFNDLIAEIALFRPGPIQGGMVHPFVRRRRGEEPITYDHPDLEPILRDTYGVILYQEQVLEIAHRFAGMSLQDADDFRALMSKFRDPGEMEQMYDRFVQGAVARGVDEETADLVFGRVVNFVGYGFCRSHAAAFAKTVYQSAYLKRHHPAAFMAAVMEHRPGMYDLMTLEEDARRFGVEILPPDINLSGIRYDLEPGGRVGKVSEPGPPGGYSANRRPKRAEGRLAIRKPLTSVAGLSVEAARDVLWARLDRPFGSVEDVWQRANLGRDVVRNLARSGAFDQLAGSRRRALWMVGLLERRPQPSGEAVAPTLFTLPDITPADIPELPPLSETDQVSWDYQTHGAGTIHPMTLRRRTLNELEIRSIETCYRMGRSVRGRPVMTVAGLAILRQRPPTAGGVMFLTLEDETGMVQCVVRPQVLEHLDHVLRAGALIVRGQLNVSGNWRGILVTQAWRLDNIFGGYEGHPSNAAGRDRHIVEKAQA